MWAFKAKVKAKTDKFECYPIGNFKEESAINKHIKFRNYNFDNFINVLYIVCCAF